MPRARSTKKPSLTSETSISLDDETSRGDADDVGEEQTSSKPSAPQKAPKEDRSYPYLNIVAEQGGVLLGVEDRQVQRPMTEQDMMDAAEELSATAHLMEEAEQNEIAALADEKKYKKLLDGARERMREALRAQNEHGKNLKSIALQMETHERRATTRVNLTITRSNEYVAVDAETNQELERRTATAEELQRIHGKSSGLISSDDVRQVSGKAISGDGSAAKDNPEEVLAVVSIDEAAFNSAKKNQRSSLMEVEYPAGDLDPLPVPWSRDNPGQGLVSAPGRLYAQVPTWATRRLRLIAEKVPGLDFQYVFNEPAS